MIGVYSFLKIEIQT